MLMMEVGARGLLVEVVVAIGDTSWGFGGGGGVEMDTVW